ncbi:serine/threonine-protein phosphatase 6 regulatory ankyrin repeat subunit B-like [Littorina saxatilis]|uniref:Uncharacterized protein n=1 Tax=Littorina saxatilis TaxID=31220 RepID=A0AAN9BUL5_9CAEN
MESSKLYTAIKANDADSVDSLLADPSTDTTLRDLDGRSLLHHAVLLEADLHVVKALAQRVDLALKDHEGNTVLDLINAGSEPEAKRKVVEDRVREVVLAGEEGQKVAHDMLLAGWFHWPVTPQEAKEKSEQAAELLGKIMGFKDKIEAVHKALQERRVSDLAQLLQADKELAGAADTTGLSPLHKAVLFQQVELVQALITEFKEALNAKDYMGRTALHYAAALKDDSVLYNLLKDAGADEAAADLVGKSPKDYQQDPDNLPLGDLTARVEKLVGKPAPLETPKAQAAEEPAAPVKQPEPPKPVQVKPVEMYIPKPDNQRLPPPSTIDGKYVAQHLGTALTQALAEIVEKKPWDPIEYLGQWLYKYRHTLDEAAQRKKLLEDIRSEEEVANGEEVIKLKRKEEEMRIQEEEERKRQEEEAARKKKEQEDLQRQAKEAILSQKPLLPTVTEEEDEDSMFRKRNGKGQTELHTLAAQSGADLVALINLGYSLADRDAENRTPRDVAEENDLTENVEAIDNYVTNLIEHENIDALKQLILEGYDKLDAVLQQVSTDGLSESLTDFVKSIPNEQQKVSAIFQAVASGKLSEVENSMDRSLALAKDQYGRSPLHLAVLAGHKDIAQYIVKHFRTSARTRDNLNRTPLHYAVALSEELSELLKANGADTNAKDFKQRTPAHYEADKEEILALKKTLLVSSDSKVTSATVPEIKADDDSSPDDADDKDKD